MYEWSQMGPLIQLNDGFDKRMLCALHVEFCPQIEQLLNDVCNTIQTQIITELV